MSLNSFGRKLRTGPLGAIFFVIVVLCVGVLAFTGLGSYVNNRQHQQAAPQAPSNVLAKVNGTAITISQFQSTLEKYKQEYESYGPTPSIASAGQSRVAAFNMLISPILAASVANQDGISVSSDEIATEREKQLGPLRSELGLSSSASESDIDTALASNNLTIDDLISSSEIKNSLLAQKYDAYVHQINQASEDEVQKYYQQVHTRHILISNKSRPDAQASALAANLITQIQKGADFATLAKEYSDDPGTKFKGGDDGFIDQSTSYAPEFKNAALGLKTGQTTSTPVLVPQYGYFIIQAIAEKSNLPKDYQKNHNQYVSQVTQALAQQQEQTDLTNAKAKAVITVTDPRLRADLAVSGFEQGTGPGVSALQGALSDYNQALNSADDSEKAEIYASEAQVYQVLRQTDKEEAALKLALANIEDSTLRVALGDIYRQQGDVKDALAQYQDASNHAYDNPDIHVQLMQDYQTLKQPALVATESAWLKQYEARQKQASAQTMPTGAEQQ